MCTTAVRVSDSCNANNLYSPNKQTETSQNSTVCMWNRTSFQQRNFYSSIKCCLSPGNNDHKAKLRRKPRSSPPHAGQRSSATRNSWRESQQDKLDHLKLGHYKISHCSNFIYKTWTNIKLGEQIPNIINRDYTYGLKSPVSLRRCQESLSQQQAGAALLLSRPYGLSQLSWDTTPPRLLLRTTLICQPNGIGFRTTSKTKAPSVWLKKGDRWARQTVCECFVWSPVKQPGHVFKWLNQTLAKTWVSISQHPNPEEPFKRNNCIKLLMRFIKQTIPLNGNTLHLWKTPYKIWWS